jgi:hypothetical protein
MLVSMNLVANVMLVCHYHSKAAFSTDVKRRHKPFLIALYKLSCALEASALMTVAVTVPGMCSGFKNV